MSAWANAPIAAAIGVTAAWCWWRRDRLARARPVTAGLVVAATLQLVALGGPPLGVWARAAADVAVLAALWTLVIPRRHGIDRGGGVAGDRVARLEAVVADADAGRRRLEQAFRVGGHGLFEIDFADRSLKVSEGFCELLGLGSPPCPPLHGTRGLVAAEDTAAFHAAYRLIELGLARRSAGDYRFHHRDGRLVWLHCRFDVAGRRADGQPTRALVVASDVSERKTNEMRLQHLALHDALTGLGNRAAFMQQQVKPQVPGTGLLLVDLDRFKEVNDRHGHHVGDAWLVEVARRLRDVTRREDFVARIGGDEFAVVPSSPLDDGALDELARRLIDRLRAPFRLQGREVAASASVGAARLAEARGDGFSLFARADVALYGAKRLGGGGYALASPADGEIANPVVRRTDRQHPA